MEKPNKEDEDRSPKEKFKKGEKGEPSVISKISYSLCEEPHKAMDYPQHAKLVAFIRSDDEAPREEAKLGTLHLLSAMKAKDYRRIHGSMFMEAEVGGKTLKALVDTDASHIFMVEDITKNIELQFTKKL